MSAEAKDYRIRVALLVKALPMSGPLTVTLQVYRPRKSGDLDNTFKVLLDALNGFAWTDDSQIVELHGFRYDDKDAPRVVVTVVGIAPSTAGRYATLSPRRLLLRARPMSPHQQLAPWPDNGCPCATCASIRNGGGVPSGPVHR